MRLRHSALLRKDKTMSNIFDIFKSIEKEKTPVGKPELVIAFLGNPGAEYARTRHNAGFMCAEYISEKYGIKMDRARFKALTGEAVFGGKKVLFLKPQTYMNLSGESVKEALSFYKLDSEAQLLVVYDDVYLDTGKLRIREKGSAGGHNGIKSIIYHTETENFARVRIGVGKPPAGYPMPDWVLGKLPENEKERFFESLERAAKAVETIASGKFTEAMNKYNG